MDQIANEINKLAAKLDAVEQLLDKDYEDWTQKEKQAYGNHEQLRKEKEQLRKKEEQLRELQILKQKQQLQGIE